MLTSTCPYSVPRLPGRGQQSLWKQLLASISLQESGRAPRPGIKSSFLLLVVSSQCSLRLSFACSLQGFCTAQPCSGAWEDPPEFGEPRHAFWLGPKLTEPPHLGLFVPKRAVLCSQEGMLCQARSSSAGGCVWK